MILVLDPFWALWAAQGKSYLKDYPLLTHWSAVYYKNHDDVLDIFKINRYKNILRCELI